MPRHAKGARLYLRQGRADRGPVYVIRDGGQEIGTGCGPERLLEAEQALAAHIASRFVPTKPSTGDPSEVHVDEVLALYAQERAPKLADPVSDAGRIKMLLDFWGERTCADVKRSTCEEYVAWRIGHSRKAAKSAIARSRTVTDQTARRELETLRSAIGYWDKERPFTRKPQVVLPLKAETNRDALTRDQAARLLKAAMGYRLGADGKTWTRLPAELVRRRRHLRRFVLLGIYSGSRPGVHTKLLWRESPTQAWADVEKGMIYRRGRSERDQRTKRRPLCRMQPRLLAHMRRWCAMDERAEAVANAAADAAGRERPKPLSSVIHFHGQPIVGKVRTSFASIVADAGLDPAITPHWLRHTAVTWLMEADVETYAAAAYAGMSPTTLEKVYSHLRPSHQSGVVVAFSRR